MKRVGFMGRFKVSLRSSKRRLGAILGVASLAVGGMVVGELASANAAPVACGTLSSGTSVYINCAVPPATQPYTTYTDGQAINLSMGPNSTFAVPGVGTSIVAIECEYTNGSAPGDPPDDSYCDAQTGPGDFPYATHADGSFDYLGDNNGDVANVWALPDPTFPHATITCDTTSPCVWYVGADYTNFSAPHVFSNPFFVSLGSTTTTTTTPTTTTSTSTTSTTTTSSTTSTTSTTTSTSTTTTSTTTTTMPTTTTTTSTTTTTTVPPTTTTSTTVPPTTTTSTTVPPSTTTTMPTTTTSTTAPRSTTTTNPTTTTTYVGVSPSGGGSTGGSGGPTPVPSSSLAFTGTGPGTRWLAGLGASLLLLGILLLAMVDAPRRSALAVAARLPGTFRIRQRTRSSETTEQFTGLEPDLPYEASGRTQRAARWILGR